MEEFKIEKLHGTGNWSSWKFQMSIIMKSMDLYRIIDGTYKKPVSLAGGGDAVDAAFLQNLRAWEQLDIKAQRLIITSIDNSMMKYLMCCKEAYEMWEKLNTIHELHSEVSVHLLQQQFYEIKKIPEDTIEMHIAKIEELVERLRNLGEPLSEKMVITKILMTLPQTYNHFITAWESYAEDKRTLKNLTNRLVLEQSRMNHNDVDSKAFPVKQQYHQKEIKKPGRCYKCNQEGHWIKDCPLWKNNQNRYDKQQHFTKSNAFMGDSHYVINTEEKWILDSGASEHMTLHREWFNTFRNFHEPTKVKIGDGTILNAIGEGNIDVLMQTQDGWKRKFLQNVLFVPKLKVNLFSATTAMDKGYEMYSNKNICKFIRDGKFEALGYRNGNLFEMKMKVLMKHDTNFVANSNGESLEIWHQRLVHQNIKHVKEILQLNTINHKENNDDINKICEGCCLGKQHRMPFTSSTNRATSVGELIHADICGPMEHLSIGGSKYFLLLKDDFSRFKWVYFLQHKNDVGEKIKEFVYLMKNQNVHIKIFRSDNGLEFINKNVEQFLKNNGIIHQRSVTYTPEQNGAAERELRTIVELARSVLQAKGLHKILWAEAVHHVVYVLNRTGYSSIKNKSPFELLFNKSCKITHLKVFGSEVFSHIPKQIRKKWDAKSKKGIFVGFDDNVKGCRVYFEKENKIEIFRDVIFGNELEVKVNVIGKNRNEYLKIFFENNCNQTNDDNPSMDNNQLEVDDSLAEDEPELQIDQVMTDNNQNDTVIEHTTSQLTIQDNISSNNEEDSSSESVLDQSNNDATRDVQTKYELRPNPKRKLNFDELYLSVMEEDEPKTYEEAIKSKNSKKWKDAMDEEYESLIKNNTWVLSNLPEGRKLIDCRWIYKIKSNSDGSIERYKARLVARGFTQEYGLDYEETFSPVVKYDSIRILLAIAVSEGMSMKQFDIKTAFLYGELKEEIFMSQPVGYNQDSKKVCKLKKSLYGLKQAPRCFNKKFCEILEKFDMKISNSDACVFIKNVKGSKLILAIYVDDGLLIYNDDKLANELLLYLKEIFEIKECKIDKFLGFQMNILNSGSLVLHQYQYTEKVLNRFNMNECNSVSTPLEPGWITNNSNDKSCQNYPYKELIGSLIYLSIVSRPDISYAVGVLSRYMENPCQIHINAAKRVLRYLKGTMDYGLVYSGQGKLILKTFSDSDYAGDTENRRSTSGIVTKLGNCTVGWKSQQQRTVALSTTEAEYIAACEAVKDIVWMNRFLNEISDRAEANHLYLDNQSTIKLIKNPEYHKRTKHIDVKYHFIREKFNDAEFQLYFVNTKEQLADILTKALPKPIFECLRNSLNVLPNC